MRVAGFCGWIWLVILIFGSCVMMVESQRTFLDSLANVELLRAFRKWTGEVIGRTGREPRLLRTAMNQDRTQSYYGGPFPCNTSVGGRSAEVPKSVHQLRPGDIDVIGAMGDSLTAGLGIFATSLLHLVIENRGVVASGGGQGTWREFLTLPNILKEFNPNLIGYALTDSFTFEKASQFNVAESGAISRDMPYMAQAIINRMKSDPRVNVKKHWKMITLMIGANDFCTEMCYLPEASMTLSNHKNDLLQVLRLLRDELPRTFVSIVPPPHLQQLVEITGRSSLCELTVNFECSCLFGLVYRSQRQKYYDIMTSWQRLDEEIAQYPEFQRDDFTVVVQPLTTNLTFPVASNGLSDLTYLSTDCFHVSQKGNARTANALWNNLMQPVGQKSRNWPEIFGEFVCPTERRPYIATPKNSRN
ncbi:phospholipase B1, membrane-associated [Nasonia vitripennis]|uniref:Phospholipase B1, membrane-associated n=1 Tax=Nasonia vitripennis TaxID=7425 RepID=A0A7M7H762_NASVI|nr:phospholipase B1, membrane-associated [Nasonia vitripennis]